MITMTLQSPLKTFSAMSPAHEQPAVSSEARLLDAARGGDTSAFGALVRRHERRVFALVGRFFRQSHDVDDVAQETFLRAWQKLSSYRAEAPFEHWLTRVCLNVCYQQLRRRRLDTVDPEKVPEPRVADYDPTAAMEASRLLARLDPRDRFVLLLLDGEGWSTADIAERLGWSRVNVKVRAHRARKKLLASVQLELAENRQRADKERSS